MQHNVECKVNTVVQWLKCFVQTTLHNIIWLQSFVSRVTMKNAFLEV